MTTAATAPATPPTAATPPATETKAASIGSPLLWWVVLLIVPARFVFSVLAQAVAAAVLWATGDATPWETSAGWWTVYGTLTDILCMLVLIWALRVEGRRVRDLVVLGSGGLKGQFTAIPIYLLALLPFVGASALIAFPFYNGVAPGQIAVIDLPVWATVFSVAVWPLVWAVVEQLFYLGYLLPRLERLTGKTWLAVVIVVAVWGGQHLAVPFIADGTYLLSRLLTALVVALGMTLVFVWLRRRLVTTTIIHWLADAPTALLPLLLVSAA